MKRFSPSFFIGSISIGTVEGASCVNLGNNLPSGFVNYKKQNQGFGSISGDHNGIHDILATIEENGTQDAFHYEGGLQGKNEQVLGQIEQEMLASGLDIEEQDEEKVNGDGPDSLM
ncbi:hypothetical protein Q5O02_05175 [Bacillus stercoris]|uniref:hypothetical protein n=1 Tax=Bacillus stercoris TaxID=2054641 RepID=UPI0026FA12E9|nr:hypothetical protein [Bacillus stercoris]MDO7345530.1 hypothetical protein [Bacillus stercoris]